MVRFGFALSQIFPARQTKRKTESRAVNSVRWKPIVYSAVNLIAATWVYRYLVTGGWLRNDYRLNDPNIVNLLLAIFEPVAVVAAIAYWIWPTRPLYRLLFITFLVQVLIAIGFLAFILLFFFTWKPKMM